MVTELQYYFEQNNVADVVDEDFSQADRRGKANGILRKLENYGWIEIETEKSYVHSSTEHSGIVLMQILEHTDYLITV